MNLYQFLKEKRILALCVKGRDQLFFAVYETKFFLKETSGFSKPEWLLILAGSESVRWSLAACNTVIANISTNKTTTFNRFFMVGFYKKYF
jgi:hypothetical protein